MVGIGCEYDLVGPAIAGDHHAPLDPPSRRQAKMHTGTRHRRVCFSCDFYSYPAKSQRQHLSKLGPRGRSHGSFYLSFWFPDVPSFVFAFLLPKISAVS